MESNCVAFCSNNSQKHKMLDCKYINNCKTKFSRKAQTESFPYHDLLWAEEWNSLSISIPAIHPKNYKNVNVLAQAKK